MSKLVFLRSIVLFLFVAACSQVGLNGLSKRTGPSRTVDVAQLPSIRVVGVVVNVPETLSVTEANTYKPRADIVWREDPLGDRRAQVKTIVEEAARRGSSGLQGDLPVVLHIDLRKFHALTQITRASFGGTHAIDFLLTVTNGDTGAVVVPAYFVRTDLRAYGAAEAARAESVGQTQKVRITSHLAGLIRQELTGIPAQTVAQATPPPT